MEGGELPPFCLISTVLGLPVEDGYIGSSAPWASEPLFDVSDKKPSTSLTPTGDVKHETHLLSRKTL